MCSPPRFYHQCVTVIATVAPSSSTMIMSLKTTLQVGKYRVYVCGLSSANHAPLLAEQVYEAVGEKLVYDTMNGQHGTILAYGQTNSGKTYTMKGVMEDPGLIALSVQVSSSRR